MGIPSIEWDEHRATTKYWLAEPEDKESLEETIKRMAKMDHSACAEFYDRTSSVVHGVVQQILNNPAIAEEVTLDVYLQVWRRAGEYSELRETPMTWLILLARTHAIVAQRFVRQENRENSMETNAPAVELLKGVHEREAAPRRRAVVRSALITLAPRDREAIELAFYSGLSHNAIAEKLAVPIGSVKAGIRMGMSPIREHLGMSDDASWHPQPASGVRAAVREVKTRVYEWAGIGPLRGKRNSNDY